MHNIKIMFFRESIRRYALLPEQRPQVKKAIICAFIFYVLKCDFLSLKALKQPIARKVSETMSQRTIAVFVGFCLSLPYNSFCVIQSYNKLWIQFALDFNNKHSEDSASRIQEAGGTFRGFSINTSLLISCY